MSSVISDVTAQARQREEAARDQYCELVLSLLSQTPPATEEVERILDAAGKSAADIERDLLGAEERHKLIDRVIRKPEADAKSQKANRARQEFAKWKLEREAEVDERDSEVRQLESQAASLRNRVTDAEIKLSKQLRNQRAPVYELLRQLASADDGEKQQIVEQLKTLQVRDLVAG